MGCPMQGLTDKYRPHRIAEFERELIRDRVKSGIAAARTKGKRLGRPRRVVDADRIAGCVNGRLLEADRRRAGVGVGTARARFGKCAKNPS